MQAEVVQSKGGSRPHVPGKERRGVWLLKKWSGGGVPPVFERRDVATPGWHEGVPPRGPESFQKIPSKILVGLWRTI